MIAIVINKIELFGLKIIDCSDFVELLIHFLFNLLVMVLIVRYIYYSASQRKPYLFTYMVMSTIIFFLCHLLDSVKLHVGLGFGLFAVFGIIRYRANTISIREMTYFFVVIALSLMNSISGKEVSFTELIIANIIVYILCLLIEKIFWKYPQIKVSVQYDKPELIKGNETEQIKKDLENRLCVNISSIETKSVDYQQDIINLNVYYTDTHNV